MSDWTSTEALAAEHCKKLLATIEELRQRVADFPQEKYDVCRGLCDSVGKRCPFLLKDPKDYPRYLEIVKHPIWLEKILLKLDSCSYDSPKNFIDDMRLLLDNCFTFNNENEATSLAREAEIEMEEVFKTRLGEPAIHSNEIRDAVGKLAVEEREGLKRIYCLYSSIDYIRGAPVSIKMDTLSDALKRRMLRYAQLHARTGAPVRKRPLKEPAPLGRKPPRAAADGEAREMPQEVVEDFHAMDPVPVNRQTETFPSPDEDYGEGGDSP